MMGNTRYHNDFPVGAPIFRIKLEGGPLDGMIVKPIFSGQLAAEVRTIHIVMDGVDHIYNDLRTHRTEGRLTVFKHIKSGPYDPESDVPQEGWSHA